MADSIFIGTPDASLIIEPLIPGCTYTFEVQPANGDPVFDGTFSFTVPEAEDFSGYDISAEHFVFSMCLTPNKADWDRDDLTAKDYTNTFTVGQSASFSIRLNHAYNTSPDNITTLFVIRDADGSLVRADTWNQTWTRMWYQGYGKLTIPVMPENPGEYTVEIYFNGMYVTTESFTIQ